MRRFFVYITAVLIFLIPSNLFLKFAVPSAYVNGLLVDYLLPKLYLSDIPIFLLLLGWAWEAKQHIQFKNISRQFLIVSFTVLAAFCLRQFLTTKPLAAIWFLTKSIEILALASFFFTHRSILKDRVIWWSLAGTVLFQSILGIYQFQRQQSFFPSYYFLGEINYGHPLSLATGTFAGAQKILPYGTTAHPNILAGFLVFSLLIILLHQPQKTSPLLIAGVALTTLYTVLLTQSVVAILCLGLAAFFWLTLRFMTHSFAPQFLLSLAASTIFITPFVIHQLALLYPANPSFVRRDVLNQAAANMIIDRPLVGVGVNNFTAVVEQFFHSQEVVRFVQPAHNIFLLFLAETGLLGVAAIVIILYGFWKWRKPKHAVPFVVTFWILLPAFLFDHYLLTQQTGLLILIFFCLQFSYFTKGESVERSS